ncbi:RND family efflux transporter, MFP subunit [Halanaerobium congolense]|uniref:RND family efflux transporter, MFP subunit n=1 Tax=Halanaerobium congolense TaxID=54121 RepID=A0A1G8MIN8_9FIRM|nr:efflux RND transporter periplasmic adaptor subunit [Halanaerobium congolense]SDI67170.1 RND family efflux transporter, MFP subunit [Halanaerobium congolense]SET64021.1 RND family efflux transporter, MFP subunit [Halanaerobium congolense]
MRNRKILVLILLLVFISSTAFAQNNTQVVETAKSIKEDISINEIITGILTPIQDVNVPAQIGGVAEKINVEIGEEVKKDEELIKIDDESLLIQKKQAEASLEKARANYQELKNGVTKEEMDRVRSTYENAKASLESAEINLKLMEELYNDRRALEQQLVSAEQQLESSRHNLNQAKINYEQAKRDYDRSKKLYNDDVVSEKEFDNAKSAFENAEVSLNQAKSAFSLAEESYQLAKKTFNNPTELKQQLENARRQVKNARSNLEVARANLAEAERGPRQERVRAGLASVRQAEASLAQIEDQISKTQITAPVAGLINKVNIDQGEIITAGQTVIHLVNTKELYAEIDVTASTASAVKKGEVVEVKAETMQHYIEGEITNISPAANPSSRTYLVKAKIPNPDHRLRAGMFADVKIAKGKSGSAVVVPIESIVNLNSDNPYLFVVEDGKAVRKDLKIGIKTDSRVEILAGLNADEDVIIRGQSNLEAGQEVEVRN